MSLQPKTEKTDAQVRRAGGRPSGGGHQQHPPRGGGGVGGHGPHNSSNTSGKRSNGPGGQSRVNPNAGSLQSNASVKVQNGSHTQRHQAGQGTALSGNAPLPAPKQSNVVPPRSNGILPKPPMSQASNIKSSEQTTSESTTFISGDSNRPMLQQPIAFQFGSFSPVSINGFQIPARTSSAPPNFDEQKRDQARSGAATDVPGANLLNALSGTPQRQQTNPGSKQGASTIDHHSAEGKIMLPGTNPGVSVSYPQELPGGRKPSAVVLKTNNPSASQVVGVVPGSLPPSSYLHSQNAPSGSRAPNSQHQSQGSASQLHLQSSQLTLQSATPGLHAHTSKVQSQSALSSSQLQSQGNTGLHTPSAHLQSQVVTAGPYVPSSQLQSQALAPGSRPLPIQMPQVQPAFGSQGLPTGALPSQAMIHHGISYAQPMRHLMPQQVNTHLTSQQFITGNSQMNAQIPIQINPQLTSSIGAHIPQYVSSSQTNQYNIPQRTSTVKITHPETHEELKFGPKGVKSDSHTDNGVVTLVSDSNPSSGSLPPYGPAHSSSIPVSGLHTKNFYPSVSVASYGHPPFQQPPKTTTTARLSIVRPSVGQTSAPVNHFGASVDLSKQPSNAIDSSSASATLTSHSSHGSNISTTVAAKKEEIQPDIHVAKISVSDRSDAGTKQSMPVSSPKNPSDVVVSNSSAVSGGNNHVNEEHNTESGKPGCVPMKEQPRKVIKSESKHKKQQSQHASLLRTSSNAQVELKVEMVPESLESDGSYPEPDKCILNQSKHKKQHQPQVLLKSSSNARSESKREVVTDSSEVGATCTEADKFGSATVSLKTAKPVDGGATPELARKAIETVLHSSSLDLSSVTHASSNVPSNFSKVEKIISKSSSANTSDISEISSSGVVRDLQPPFIDPSASVQHSEYGQRSAILATFTTNVQDGSFEVTNKFFVEKAQEEKEFKEEKVGSDNLVTVGNSMSSKPVPESDSNNRDKEKLYPGSESNSDTETCTNSNQSASRDSEHTKITLENVKNESNVSPDLLALPINSSTRNEKSQLLDEEVRVNETKGADMICQCPEFDNGTFDDQNLVKDKTEEAFQCEEKVSRPGQPGMLIVDDIVGSEQSAAHASTSGLDTITRLEDASPVDVKSLDTQDKAQLLIHNSSGTEGMTPSSQLLSLSVESEGKSDSLGKVQEKETKCSSNALLNSKSTIAGDVPKIVVNKKKKKKELLSKADAAAPTGDLYNAYKVPEKQEDLNSLEPCNVVTAVEEIPPLKETEKQLQKEVDDWEDAAELSTNVKQVTESIADGDSSGDRRYSRDFLLTFRAQFKDLPPNFEIRQDIKDLMDNQSISTHHVEGEYMGRALDGQLIGNSRLEDKWTKDAFTGGRDMRMEVGVSSSGGFRPNQCYNTGFGKNMRGQANSTGILPSGPFGQGPYPQGGLTRNNSDVDRWQRGSAFQKGLIPPPPAPSTVIHKTENRYEVRKVSDEEEKKQRQIKAILNKLTPQNFDKLFLKVQEVNIDSAVCLIDVISQIFDKALMEPTFCEMYAKFCYQLAAGLPDIYENNEKVTFKRELLNKCQEEFERDEREQAEAQNAEDGEIKLSKEELEGKRIATRRRMLGNIRFIGELYKESMLTERIMHECIKKLLGEYENPDEENVEALCKLMSTIGHMIDHSKAKDHMDCYFVRITTLASNQVLPSRLRFMLKDVIDLRKNGWQQRRKVDGPKKIEEVHRDAAQERQAAAMGGRLNRTPSMGHSGRRVSTPPDHGSRGPPMQPFMAGAASGSMSHMSGMRGSQAQTGGRGFQDARIGERTMPLPQRPSDDGHLTLGPQGGLARGISGRAQPLPSNRSALADGSSLSLGSSRRASLASRDEISSRTYSVEKPLLTKSGISERNVSGSDRREYRNSYSFNDKCGRATIAEYQQESSHGISSSQLSEENLAKNSNMTIKEFYSSRDMEEAALCVTDLKAPLFHPTLVSLWITDSFDRKDIERNLLGNLLTHLNRTVPVVLSQEHLSKGLDNVLASLEDSVVDAPKAPQFLGRILGKLVIADIFSLNEVAVLLEKGGAEPGSLLEDGLALDVLGSVLEFIREKDDKTLLDLYKSSGVRLEGFMSRKKPVKVESFLEKNNIQCLSPLISRHM